MHFRKLFPVENSSYFFRRQPCKMVNHSCQQLTNCLSVFDLLVGFVLKGLIRGVKLVHFKNIFKKIHEKL